MRRYHLRDRRPQWTAILSCADDDPACLEALVLTLQLLGIPVISAEDGVQALKAAIANRPRLIFMDLDMPNADGFQTTQAIHQHPELAETPIVAMSGHCDGQRWQAFKADCVHWIKKPWTLDQVSDTLNRFWLRGADTVRSASPQNRRLPFGSVARAAYRRMG